MFKRGAEVPVSPSRVLVPSATGSPPPVKPRARTDAQFLVAVYIGAVLVRLIVGGTIIFGGHTAYFGGDQETYDGVGWALSQSWQGQLQSVRWVARQTGKLGQNGMYYWVAALYSIVGHSPFIALIIQVLIVCLTPILSYRITVSIYGSERAARYVALATAFLPSMVIWSCLLLKDPIILFLLVTIVYCTLKMQREIQFQYIVPALAAMVLVFPFRGYVFYFILLAVLGSLLMARFGRRPTLPAYFARLGGVVIIAAALFAFGFDRIATEQLDSRILEHVQSSRLDLAHSARSGFAKEADVSTLSGAAAFLPRGVLYLLFAPFPWQIGSARYMLAIPETVCWYLMFPYCVVGILYSIRRHLRDALVIFLFVVQLTCFYGVFVGNVGTAHRQRTQVFVFYLMFTAVGWVYSRQKRQGFKGTVADHEIAQ